MFYLSLKNNIILLCFLLDMMRNVINLLMLIVCRFRLRADVTIKNENDQTCLSLAATLGNKAGKRSIEFSQILTSQTTKLVIGSYLSLDFCKFRSSLTIVGPR